MLPEMMAALFGDLEVDERFRMHRYYSSRFALTVGLILIVAWVFRDLIVLDEWRSDLLIIGAAMGAAKLIAMAYYRIAR
jgi:hypothetical protein